MWQKPQLQHKPASSGFGFCLFVCKERTKPSIFYFVVVVCLFVKSEPSHAFFVVVVVVVCLFVKSEPSQAFSAVCL